MNKDCLRQKYKTIRKQLSEKRRLEAQNALTRAIYPILNGYNRILSFASLKDEIDLWPLNLLLAKESRLYIPKMQDSELVPYQVQNLETALERSHHNLLEPKPSECQSLDKKSLDCILVPGLCFDENNYRLGYGLGHFDRFLKDILTTPTIGLGFKEQYISKLPVESHDIPLTKVYLF